MTHPPSPPPPRRGFWPFIALQAQGAFSDNVIKQMALLLAAAIYADNENAKGMMNGVLAAAFVIPSLLFSCWAGFMADRFSKRSVALTIKLAEIGIMMLAVAAMTSADLHTRLWLGVTIVFLMGTHSAFFSPAKYSILPELVPDAKLTWANGILELTTFVAIILGISFATYLFNDKVLGLAHMPAMTWILVAIAAGGLLVGQFIKRTPPANPERPITLNFLPELKRYLGILRTDRTLALSVLGLSYFWGFGLLLLSHVNVWGEAALGYKKEDAGWLYDVLALGIGIGSGLAGMISRRQIELGLVPVGGIGMALFCLPLALATPELRGPMLGCLFLVGVSAGFFSVPLNALLQHRSSARERGGLLAASNYITSASMLFFSLLYIMLNKMGVSPRGMFVFCGVMTSAATVVILKLLPQAFVRFVALMLTGIFYRVRVGGAAIPESGPLLLVSNHVSFMDAVLIQTSFPRPVRFVVWTGLYKNPVLGALLRIMHSIPVAPDQKPRELITSLRVASEALSAGEVVCIFAEGQMTRTGMMQPIQRGYQLILKSAPPETPVLPVYLDGLWGSVFSFERGKFFWKRPRAMPYPVRVNFGKPLPPRVDPETLRQSIDELGAETAIATAATAQPLHHAWFRVARRRWSEFAMVDGQTPALTRGESLIRAIILARKLGKPWAGQETVGMLLPPAVGAALVNYAAALTGRTTVNLNYTTGPAILESCARRSGLKTVVTSRTFLEKLNITPPAQAIYLEDLRGDVSTGEKLKALIAARLLPMRAVERYCGAIRRPDASTLATIIFSSGSTGEPKGVMLSHANIAANVESVRQGIRLSSTDRLLGTLPFFHSFGYTVAMWGSAIVPFGAVYHNNPLDVKAIGELCEKERVTLIITTPTFLQHYIKRIPPGQLGGLTCVITGAERLPDRVREAFTERFGIEPMQGYGTTECAPVVATNVDDFHSPGMYQVGHKRGSIGHPLPGIAVRIVNLNTGEPVKTGEAGLLLVRGANVMQGYLGMPEKSAEVLKDGWYNTGDVAKLDDDGFIFITDRLSRFSKIGGEMVPHVMIEEKLIEVLGQANAELQPLAVTAVPDEKKGEQLIVLHTLKDEELAGLQEKLQAAGMPNLYIPRRENFIHVDTLPLLGTGKLDLAAMKELARLKSSSPANAPQPDAAMTGAVPHEFPSEQ